MKYFFYLLFACSMICSGLRGEVVPRPATVVAVKGNATSSGAGASGQSALKPSASIAANSRIVTTAGGEVTLRFFDGTVAVVQPESDLTIETLGSTIENGKTTKETTLLNLRAGTVVTTLNPAKKDVTDYRIRTPKGMAVARGTVFAVRVTQDQSSATVSTMSGTVTFVTDRGEVTVGFGQVSSGNGVMTVAQAVAADPSLAQFFVDAAISIAGAIGAGAGGSAEQTAAVLAAVVEVAAEASPSRAAEVAASVVRAAAPALGSNASNAVAAITQAAVQGATKTDPASAPAIGNAVASAVTAAVATTSLNVSPAVVQAAASPATAAGSTVLANPILPPLDQTQVVVSPSRP